MDPLSIAIALGLTFLVGVFIARPWLIPGDRPAASHANELDYEREANLSALRELDFDHLTGKIADEDYAAQRAALVAHGVGLLQQLETVAAAAPLSADAQLEAEVRAARARPTPPPAAGYCPQCGAAHETADRFCAKCGAPLMRPA